MQSQLNNADIVTDPHLNTQLKTKSSKANSQANYSVIRRNGQRTPYDRDKIAHAMSKAFLAVEGNDASKSQRIHDLVERLVTQVEHALHRDLPQDGVMHIEAIQDQVELALMRSGEHNVARAYVLYRHEQAVMRLQSASQDESAPVKEEAKINITNLDEKAASITHQELKNILTLACQGIDDVDSDKLFSHVIDSVYDGISAADLNQSMVLAARSFIDLDPNYSNVSARLLLNGLRNEAFHFIYNNQSNSSIDITINSENIASHYPQYFKDYIHHACELELLDDELKSYDLDKLGNAILAERDFDFDYLGLQTLYDRYFIHSGTCRFELPQAFFMRVAMGLAINESDREARAIEFYTLLSSFDFMSSTPTLFNSGTPRPQLSSCYLTTIPDSLDGIYNAFKDNALLSKYAGGLGNDWTRVRGLGSQIKGTNGHSQGVVPFMKVANDTAVAVNQGGKRKGAVCGYLETWHIDIDDFLELRKNTGDERRRTHDMNTANWIPDLFMQRVVNEQKWTLFSPEEVSDLHDLTGVEFANAYEAYERQAQRGELKLFKEVSAVELWRKMLSMIFETGHPWITFKDPCNIRYTNQHMGMVHSSNLCTEITLHTNDDEIAVCNLGSVNLAAHVDENGLNTVKLKATVSTAMRMLDNVIDYNYYSVPQAKHSNSQHRPVGLGLMGFQDALYKQAISYASEQAIEFADESMELISYFAIQTSCELAQERGAYPSYDGSLWSQGILPIDSAKNLADQRKENINQDLSFKLDWQSLREKIKQHGMRNSNCLAIAPTATISNICGVSQSIEPSYQNLYVKSNLSGEFTVVNKLLVSQLKEQGLWDEVMSNDLKYFDGSVQSIDRIPDSLKQLFLNAFEMDSRWLIEAASRRQKWLDQAQSLNLYMAEPSGKKLDQLYKLAWVRGLKTTYYLRSLGATHAEKAVASPQNSMAESDNAPKVCSITDPDCEACQ